jgi:hypothetical protein
MFDDANRSGEKATIKKIIQKLEEHQIEYASGEYNGAKGTTIIVSQDLKFLCSL